MSTAFAENFLGAWDDEAPSQAGKVEDLADGEYDFQVQSAAWKVLERKSMAIVEATLEVLSAGKHAGQKVEFSWFIQDKDGRDRVLRDLTKLGFDCPEWTTANLRPISVELPKAPKVLKGMRFSARKTSKKTDDGKVYHNLWIGKRVLTDGKPERIGPQELDARDDDDPFPG